MIGQTIEQPRNNPPVPKRRWRGGKKSSVQIDWESPPPAKNKDIVKGSKPKPPRLGSVNQNSGRTKIMLGVEVNGSIKM
jgi:hypothetical protein